MIKSEITSSKSLGTRFIELKIDDNNKINEEDKNVKSDDDTIGDENDS